MPMPAGTGMTRRDFVSRSPASPWPSTAAALLAPRLRQRHRPGRGERLAQNVLVSMFLAGGIDGLSVLFPAGDPLYYELRPNLALPQTAGSRTPRTPGCAGIRRRRHRDAPRRGQGSVIPAIGYANSDQSHFTSRHYWEVGATDADLRTGWLGRYLDQVGTADNPLQGLTLDVALQPALATAKVPVATIAGRRPVHVRAAGTPAASAGVVDFQEAANLGAAHASSPTRPRDGRRDRPAPRTILAPSSASSSTGSRARCRTRVSTDPFPHRLAGLAAMIAQGLPLHMVAITSPGHFDTHATQAATLTSGLQLTSDSLLAFQRDLEARGIADRVLVHVWSEFGRRAQPRTRPPEPTTARPGSGFLIGTRRERASRSACFPGLTGGLDPTATCSRPPTSARSTRRSSSSGSTPTRTTILPGVRRFQRPTLLQVRLPRGGGAAARSWPPAASPAKVCPDPRPGRRPRSSSSRSRAARVQAGPAIVELVNFGEDPHDLRIAARRRRAHLRARRWLQPGDYYDLAMTLLPGKYMLWCSIANHRALGMQATLVVTPKAAAK